MDDYEIRVAVKRPSKKKGGFKIELRHDGFYYVKSVPSRKSSIQPGDRVMEINGINYTEFKTAATANDLLDTVIIYVLGETEVDSGEEGTSYEGRSQSESYGY